MRRIKIYGGINCGTNYLERMIMTNLHVNILPGVAPDWIGRFQAFSYYWGS